ncbi:tetratricopeptide repeat protein [Kitasatospora sp. NBC_01287]|uniref:AfsR/SARP family transcriptional regulator n=1 Tax=Kitasatospora sp. NBC_01287 TaxID=2903573 RepID=UPI00224EBBB0|nr:tetratricopeptide repeat protein [Kitasatospora sp. NBC_01287]MCX4744415.1 tetratricopeptide repeat protein [Kitasatospora sp. NBC_01287]
MTTPPAQPHSRSTPTGSRALGPRFGVLGPLRVLDAAGTAIEPATPKLRTVLALLLLDANTVVSRDRLRAALWGEEQPATATTSLNNHVVRLRRLLSESESESNGEGDGDGGRLRTVAPGYLLRVEPGELDTDLFTQHLAAAATARQCEDWHGVSTRTTAALALWRGEPLDDVPGLPEETLPRLEQLREGRLQALEWLFDAELRLGRHQGLVPELTRAAAENPLREVFHGQLMLALHRMDRRAEALAVHRRLRRTLVDELGIEPGGTVRAIHQEILATDHPGHPGYPGHPVHPEHAEPARAQAPDATPGAPSDATSGTGTGTAPAPGTAPAGMGLPWDIASFTGRLAEVDQLLAACRAAARGGGGVLGIHAVDGMPGVGKSALAVHVAHRLAAEFPDGQIFLPLHAHTPGAAPVDPADALLTLLHTIGVAPQQIPPGLDARAGLWRTRLAGQRILLLLDDARSTEQVRPLLPGGAGTVVLVTSRRRLAALDGALPISLRPLPRSEALALFTARAGRPDVRPEDPAVAELVRLCGQLPLALQLTAARLRHHPVWSAADLVADLTAATGRLDALRAENVSVSAAFDLSYRDLTDDQQLLFRRLGLLPGDEVDAAAAAALAGIAPAAAGGLLEELADHHLVEESARGRYRMHDLVREYARGLAAADPAPGGAPLDRLLDHYLRMAAAANRRLSRHSVNIADRLTARPAPAPGPAPDTTPTEFASEPATEQQATDWLRVELGNLRAAVQHAAGNGRPAHAIALSSALHEFLRFADHWHDARLLHGIALTAARESGDHLGQAAAHTQLGIFDQLGGRYEEGLDHHRQALALLDETRTHQEGAPAADPADPADPADLADLADRLRIIVLTNLGEVQQLANAFPEAAAHHRQALELARRLGDRLGEANALTYLGRVQQRAEDFEAAAENHRQALAIFREFGRTIGLINAHGDLGVVQQDTGQYEQAAANHREAQRLARGRSRKHEGNALTNLGIVLYATGDYPAAEDSLRQATEIFTRLEDRRGLQNVFAFLGMTHQATGQYEQAAADLRQALRVGASLGTRLGTGRLRALLGDILRESGDLAGAREHLEAALAVAQEVGDRGGESGALLRLGRVLLVTGPPAEALARATQALEIADTIKSPLYQAFSHEVIGNSQCLLGRTATGLDHLARAVTVLRELGAPDELRVRAALDDWTARAAAGAVAG